MSSGVSGPHICIDNICIESFNVSFPLCMHGAGYHDGFIIPAGATSIQITEVSFNPIVYLGECRYACWSEGRINTLFAEVTACLPPGHLQLWSMEQCHHWMVVTVWSQVLYSMLGEPCGRTPGMDVWRSSSAQDHSTQVCMSRWRVQYHYMT